jgi:ligand-binding sensor domain-containing protein
MLPGKKIVFCFFCGFIYTPAIFGQYKFEKPVVIGKEQGLPNNHIQSFHKGKDGFIWMATSEGLSRFDGRQVKTFSLTKNFDIPPFTNSANAVLPVDNEIWVGTDQGLSVLNSNDYTFRHYQFGTNRKSDSLKKSIDQQVSVLFRDRSGKIWIGTRNKGVCVYDAAKDDFHFFSFSRKEYPALFPSVGSDNSILSFEASKRNDSIIWAGTPAGLLEINKYSGKVSVFIFPQENKDYQIALNAFRRLYYHDDGLLYVGSWAAGVNIFDPLKKTFTPIEVKNENGKKIFSKAIGRIYRKNDHEMWISSMAGLAIYDTKLKDVTWSKFNNSVENEFYAVDFIDEAGRMWHSDINGLQYFDPAMQQFSRYSFKQLSGPEWGFAFYILSDKSGNNITVCPRMTDGLYRFNRLKKEWTKFLFPREKTFRAEKDAIRGFVQLPSGDFIISADRGLFTYSEKTKKITPLLGQLPFSVTRRGELLLDHLGNLWISDDAHGLIKWKPGTATYRIYKTKNTPEDTIAFTGRALNLFEDSRGNIWFQRLNGFGVYLAAKDSIENFVYTQNHTNTFSSVHAFAEDKKGRVWINDEDGNVGYALSGEPGKGIVYKLDKRDDGDPAYLPGLAVDALGNVWGYNSTGLFKINADDLSFTTYSFRYGIDEVDFFHFSFLPSGEMVFGGRNDIIIADPSELKRNTEIPVPYIDQLEVLNRPYKLTMNESSLRLNHKQNFLSIGFSALAFTMANQVLFRYRLKGFDDWKEATGLRFANYTNVPGGDYVFQLKVANNEGVWNEKTLEMPIHIGTAWWLTWWFRIGFLLMVGALTYWFYRYRVGQIRKKEKLKSQYEKKLANVEMTALLAQMNPHFLFNSLNSIDSYIIKNESGKASEYLNNFARLMRLILQNSRSNYISLKDELETLDLYLQMEGLRFSNRFEYEIKVDEGVDAASIVIPPMLIQPYVENAIWHGLMHKKDGTPGKVEIHVSTKDNNLICLVKDNGIGREKAEEIKAQKPGNHKRSMGMQITSDRIDMINKLYDTNTSVKVIDLRNEEGKSSGTQVKLIIPF